MIAGGERWLEIATFAGGWPKSGRKSPKEGLGCCYWVGCGIERRRREEERENHLHLLGAK